MSKIKPGLVNIRGVFFNRSGLLGLLRSNHHARAGALVLRPRPAASAGKKDLFFIPFSEREIAHAESPEAIIVKKHAQTEPINHPTGEPDFDGVLYRQALETITTMDRTTFSDQRLLAGLSDQNRPAFLAATVLKILDRWVGKKNRLPKPRGLTEILIALYLRQQDFELKPVDNLDFLGRINLSIEKNLQSQNGRLSFIAETRKFKSDILKLLPSALTFLSRIYDCHGETRKDLRFFTPEHVDEILAMARDRELKQVLFSFKASTLQEVENRVLSPKASPEETFAHSIQIAEALEKARANWESDFSLRPWFFFCERLQGGNLEQVNQFWTALENFALKMESTNPASAPLLKRFLLMRDEMLVLFREHHQDDTLAAQDHAFFFSNHINYLLTQIPNHLLGKVRSPADLAEMLFTHVLSKWKIREAIRFYKEMTNAAPKHLNGNHNFFTHFFKTDGKNFFDLISQVPGFETFCQDVTAALEMDRENHPLSKEEFEDFIHIYFFEVWVKIIEHYIEKKWPKGPNEREKVAFPLEKAFSLWIKDRRPIDVVRETVANMRSALATIQKARTDGQTAVPLDGNWQQAALSIKLAEVESIIGLSGKDVEAENEARTALFDRLKRDYCNSPGAFNRFFENSFFEVVLMENLCFDAASGKVSFSKSPWDANWFFNQYFAQMGTRAISLSETFHGYMKDYSQSSIEKLKETGKIELPPALIEELIMGATATPTETPFSIYTDGFGRFKVFFHKYPLISREDMVELNPKEADAIADEAEKEGLYPIIFGHTHDTNNTVASEADRIAMLQRGFPELIMSIPDKKVKLYRVDGRPYTEATLEDSINRTWASRQRI